jgi:hypothetical protein
MSPQNPLGGDHPVSTAPGPMPPCRTSHVTAVSNSLGMATPSPSGVPHVLAGKTRQFPRASPSLHSSGWDFTGGAGRAGWGVALGVRGSRGVWAP